MKNKTRNQLIGLITVILLAIIFYPYIIKNKKEFNESTIPLVNTELPGDIIVDDTQISILPDEIVGTDTTTDNQSDDIQDIINRVTVESTTVQIPNSGSSAASATTSGTTTSTAITPTATNDKGYSIQLAALKNRQKIEELVAMLRLHNYDVYTDPAVPKQDQIIRLLVGPYPSKEQAELVSLDLKNLTKLNGFIVSK
ncbi:SPOR domain-containing protein [Zophobihabitans entericus]|uniref:SPOR domain-containing protein n=1 Tax=Zophobihabitans entericus TaxID=1635327 RepID=A0A6G9I8U0_9GAMM|nr:SPOR domain-containing protein [Zophobihabitans entericus]QIQ20638.1 hypothetical protein IPMB12_02415 [Zophobihabitans entericus]